MSTVETKNPYTQNTIESYKLHSDNDVKKALQLAHNSHLEWKNTEIKERTRLLKELALTLQDNLEFYSKLITQEMGKPISESQAEVQKCVFLCDFYAKNTALLLADELIETDANESFISYDPLGVILGVMPWNYPFWQVLRFAVPTLSAGNTVLLKHATNVSGCALAIEELFHSSGFPKGCFQTLIIEHDQIEGIIRNDIIRGVSLTGSEKAGRSIAELSGKHLKKTVLELGGNNACIVLEDADLAKYIETMVKARMQNNGQSCIAAKRFLVHKNIYDEFLEKFTDKVKSLIVGDPSLEDTEISVMAREDLAETLESQITTSIELGANIHFGNSRKSTYYEPTIVTEVKPGMPIFDEETFGPVAAIIKVENENEAYELASQSNYGLGVMVFTNDIENARKKISKIPDGAFFINDMVKSDPRLPFGGTKASGYGRELSREGILEFVNKKTIYINK